jgi:O-acetylserine/cysteine efflux transporter
VLLPFAGWPAKRDLWHVIVISIFAGGLNFGLVFIGLAQGSSSVSGIAIQLTTPFTLILAWPLLGEWPSIRVILGVVLAFGGVALTVVHPNAGVRLLPTLLVVGSGLAMATGTVLTKRYGPFPPLKLMAWMALLTVPQILAASIVLDHGQIASLHTASTHSWMAFAYTVLFGAIVGYGLWFWLIARCSLTRVAPFALLQTVFAVVGGVIFLHEPLTATLVAGGATCIVGVAITQSRSFGWHRWRTTASVPIAGRVTSACLPHLELPSP